MVKSEASPAPHAHQPHQGEVGSQPGVKAEGSQDQHQHPQTHIKQEPGVKAEPQPDQGMPAQARPAPVETYSPALEALRAVQPVTRPNPFVYQPWTPSRRNGGRGGPGA